ncbi:NAD-dependent epimerase/dehydratase family protein [Pseudomonas sp. W4I3]|uniref:NAD-dependent epimerase/dehydratase family protein n=1 Tax=Pseudomonas sp. W4I3 TaxID=3042294 RepID=UPI00277EA90D|nr:NAD-dependent epimerase/dehydratase family protein [Pseudomonas sp. W4I3]MDQ0739335.1 nucleoside-diphosphate-sugar epimerase [Pseudomonas sp. W4I3]
MSVGLNNASIAQKPKILLTGGTGFVGRPLLESLVTAGYPFVNVTRRDSALVLPGVQTCVIPTLSGDNNWSASLQGVEVVIHSAGRAHIMNETHSNPLQAFREVNVDATLNLARQAAEAGVKRFIFLSSIKVNGEETDKNRAFKPSDAPAPLDDYGVSKLEAEQALMALAKQTEMNVVIIRPVLVYGPDVKANFEKMLATVDKGLPLPFRTINNRRSLVFIDNLIDLIHVCIHHPKASNRIFLVSDGEDLSIGQILEKLALAMNKKSRIFSFPQPLLGLVASMVGKKEFFQRLCGSLQVDISDTRKLLGWAPPVSIDEAFAITTRSYQKKQSGSSHG